MKRSLDIASITLVALGIALLALWAISGYPAEEKMNSTPNHGVEKINDPNRQMSNFPCTLTKEGC